MWYINKHIVLPTARPSVVDNGLSFPITLLTLQREMQTINNAFFCRYRGARVNIF